MITTLLQQPKHYIVKRYYKQYLQNHLGLNMEFTEFMASKLRVSEPEATRVIRNWKNSNLTINK